MLLQFTVENFLSFRDRTVLSMLADPRVAHTRGQTRSLADREALRVSALYGANGSGKSNLVKAFALVRKIILDGTNREGDRFPIVPFKLDAAHKGAPTHIEVEFILADVHYSYGFAATTGMVHAEWLYRIDAGGETPLFTRDSGEGATITLGDALSTDPERRRILGYAASLTRNNQLFLAEAGQQKIPELAPFRQYFRHWVVVWPQSAYATMFTRMDSDSQFAAQVAQLLTDAGTGIASLRVSRHPQTAAPQEIVDLLENLGPDRSGSFGEVVLHLTEDRRVEQLELWATHESADGEATELNMREESDGTRRLLDLAPLLLDLDRHHSLCIVDELDRSLHPLLTRLFLRRFLDGSQDGSGQLIFTTHDTNILDFGLLSRDSVGFVEKDVNGRSIAYPLSELDQQQVDEVERQGRLEGAYLDGRFGAVPYLGLRKPWQR